MPDCHDWELSLGIEASSEEIRRLAALDACSVLGTRRETPFDHLVFTVAQLFRVPMAAFTLLGLDRAWSKAAVGPLLPEASRAESFCHLVVEARDLVVVEDAVQDGRYAAFPAVAGSPGVRFYIGAPLVGPQDQVVGALCAMDRLPRGSPERQQAQLRQLALEAGDLLRTRVRDLDLSA